MYALSNNPALLASDVATTATLAALLLVGLLMVYLLIQRRLSGFSRQLEAIERDVAADGDASAAPGSGGAAPTLAEIERLRGELEATRAECERTRAECEETRRECERTRERLDEPAAEPAAGSAAGAPFTDASDSDPEDGLAAGVERQLLRRGYDRVRVLPHTEEDEDGALRVRVESRKNGLTLKGFVVVRGGKIVAEKMTSSHDVFP